MLLGGEQRGRDAAEEHFLESISLGRLPGLAAEMGGGETVPTATPLTFSL